MKAKNFYGAMVLAIVAAVSSFAAEREPYGLLRRSPWIQLEVVGGRLTATNLPAAPNRNLSAERDGAEESLIINCTDGEGGLHYSYRADDREIQLELPSQTELTLSDRRGGETVRYTQKSGQPVEFVAQRGAVKQTIRAASLWHLLLVHRVVRVQLLPLLAEIEPNYDLARQVAEIQEQLLSSTNTDWKTNRSLWQECVNRLGGGDYPQREAADRQLRAGGYAAAAYLQSLDPESLDSEQKRRISRIVAAIHRRRDEPACVASALVCDATVWCAMLRNENRETRAFAARHLEELLGRKLRFDAVAEGSTREAQVATIERSLVR